MHGQEAHELLEGKQYNKHTSLHYAFKMWVLSQQQKAFIDDPLFGKHCAMLDSEELRVVIREFY